MLGVFIAYFVTIVVFAGLYLTVNKVGERYNHSDIDGGGGDSGGGGGPNGGAEGEWNMRIWIWRMYRVFVGWILIIIWRVSRDA